MAYANQVSWNDHVEAPAAHQTLIGSGASTVLTYRHTAARAPGIILCHLFEVRLSRAAFSRCWLAPPQKDQEHGYCAIDSDGPETNARECE